MRGEFGIAARSIDPDAWHSRSTNTATTLDGFIATRTERQSPVLDAMTAPLVELDPLPTAAPGYEPRTADRRQSGYSSFRQARGSGGWGLGVRSSRKPKYGATNGSGADTV
jgi:hypothetical protein